VQVSLDAADASRRKRVAPGSAEEDDQTSAQFSDQPAGKAIEAQINCGQASRALTHPSGGTEKPAARPLAAAFFVPLASMRPGALTGVNSLSGLALDQCTPTWVTPRCSTARRNAKGQLWSVEWRRSELRNPRLAMMQVPYA
jgi:hypothetical protein